MNICVINGSPRGKYSTTVHTLFYLEKRYPVHTFSYFDVGAYINAFEQDMQGVLAAMQAADFIIFAYPVYTFIAPSQLHRFIAALKASGVDFTGKFVTQVTTSKHFYDITAHRYIEDNCHDLGMKVIHGLSADMDDLTSSTGRKEAEDFFEYVLWCVANDIYEKAPIKSIAQQSPSPVICNEGACDYSAYAENPAGACGNSAYAENPADACENPAYVENPAGACGNSAYVEDSAGVCEGSAYAENPAGACTGSAYSENSADTCGTCASGSTGTSVVNTETVKFDYDTVIVADLKEDDAGLKKLIDTFTDQYPGNVRLLNIAEYPFKGGCIGCFNCAADGKCIYNDNFDIFLRYSVQQADTIIYAFTIQDHSMGPIFKTYDDRQFCNGHRTVTEGSPVAYIINGDFASEENLKNIIEARCQVGHNFLAGVGTDAATVSDMSKRLVYALNHKYVPPRNFWGVSGMKIFRDLIWLMRGLMKADHEFYKEHGIYDFPQKQRSKMIKMSLLGSLIRNPSIRKKMGNKMNEGMAAPYEKIIEAAQPKF